MKAPIRFKTPRLSVASSIMLSCILANVAGAAVIYQQTFSGSGPLHGTNVQSGTGSWFANPQFSASGAISSTTAGGGSAILPFAPVAGNIYQLSANITWVGNSTNINDWIGLGFANNVAINATESTNNANRFVGSGTNSDANIYGFSWMLHRASGQEAYEGYADNGPAPLTPGTAVIVPSPVTGTTSMIDVSIVLNTTAANWTTSYFINGNLAGTSSYDSYIDRISGANSTVTNGTPPPIDSVGFTTTRWASGSINSFTLQTIPEPSAALLGALGALGLLRRRRA